MTLIEVSPSTGLFIHSRKLTDPYSTPFLAVTITPHKAVCQGISTPYCAPGHDHIVYTRLYFRP